METLGGALPKEQARVREVLAHYKAIGREGEFAALVIESALAYADQAIIHGDLALMIRAYKGLQSIQE